MQRSSREGVAQRLGAHVVQRRNVGIVTTEHDSETPESSGISKDQMPPVGKGPDRSRVRSVLVEIWNVAGLAVDDVKRARHAEVGDKFIAVVEDEHQVFAPSFDALDGRADRVHRWSELLTPMRRCVCDLRAAKKRFELAPDRLDFGQLRHGQHASLVPRHDFHRQCSRSLCR